MSKGLFIVLEGVDGSGKSTQCFELYDWFTRMLSEENGRTGGHRGAEVARDPGTTYEAEAIRTLLKTTPGLSCAEQILLFTAARASLAKHIRARIAAGEIVICDRWLMSTLVYQADCPQDGTADETVKDNRARLITQLHKDIVQLDPDLTLTLIASPANTIERLRNRTGPKDAFEVDEKIVCARWIAYGRRAGENHINADGTPEEVHQRIVEKVEAFLAAR